MGRYRQRNTGIERARKRGWRAGPGRKGMGRHRQRNTGIDRARDRERGGFLC